MAKLSKSLPKVAVRPKLAEEVTESLRSAILAGSYVDGEHLVLEDLAEQLGVSIMPVRESLLSLSHEGLVEAQPRRGFRARPLNDLDLQDLFELHGFLSGSLAERAAATITAEQLAVLERIQLEFTLLSEKAQTAESGKRMHELNSAFHRAINHAAEGGRLRWFLRITSRLVRRDIYEATDDGIKASLRDHPQIIEALRMRNGALANQLVREHFRQGVELSRPAVVPQKAD